MSYAEATTAMIDGLPIDSLRNNNDHELKFDNHVNHLRKKASPKLNALLARIAPFLNVSKKRIIMKSFIESQFEIALKITSSLSSSSSSSSENYLLKIDL